MADEKNLDQNPMRRTPADETRDPEFEIPDPEQVDKDIEEARRNYGQGPEHKKPAA